MSSPWQPSASSDQQFDEGRFLSGTLLSDRYRITGRLGKGGMGEVYRANDLRLGQIVALKFLPENMVQDPAVLARFYSEVRIARQITHPNVCRVYDLGENDGQPFISMQFVDGENLASLLLRIGRLPADKAVEISRRLCAGLAAAHSQSVLHRDLKPANIMIDGRGQVFIMDFGLAGIGGQVQGTDVRSGTPAYMAPEQLAGREVTMKSDLYALGLVMYEMFTGKQAFDAQSLEELIRLREASRPSEISSVVRDLDPAVERIIFRCLDPDPANRPSSALAVSSALPGGDLLAAALAAGETPSPEMVAAAGTEEAMRPMWAVACLAYILVALVLVVIAGTQQTLPGVMNLDIPPEALAVQAHKFARQFGYPATPADKEWGFDYSTGYLAYLNTHAKKPIDWAAAANGEPSAIVFSYRESPKPLEAQNIAGTLGRVTMNDPPQNSAGMATVVTDLTGRLVLFSAVPLHSDDDAPPTSNPDAAALFIAAGLDFGSFKPTNFRMIPLVAIDAHTAWSGFYPGRAEYPILVQAAWWHGKPVLFQITPLPSGTLQTTDRSRSARQNVDTAMAIGSVVLLVVFGSLFAWRNMRLGKGDRQGAMRLAGFAFLVQLAAWLLVAHHVSTQWELVLLVTAIGQAMWAGAQLWLAYMALEPAVRRRWPRILITWTRVIAGNWRDPLVARDVLIGIAVGISYSLMFAVCTYFEQRGGGSPELRIELTSLLGFRFGLNVLLRHVVSSLIYSLVFFMVFFVLRLIARKEWLAGILFVLLFSLSRGLTSEYPAFTTPAYGVVYALIVATLLRFGLLAVVTTIFITDVASAFFFTVHFSAWYGTAEVTAVLAIIALTFFAFRRALGTQRLLAPCSTNRNFPSSGGKILSLPTSNICKQKTFRLAGGVHSFVSMERYLTVTIPILLVLMILGSVGAFLLYVPLVSIMSVTAVMIAMVLVFILGLQTAARLGLKSVVNVASATKSQLRVMPRPVHEDEPEPIRANG